MRTGVTVVVPPETPLFAGCHRLNGNGELTGLEWVRESGLLDDTHRHHEHVQRRRRPRRDRRRARARRGRMVAPRRRRDLRRLPQRHPRPAREGRARRTPRSRPRIDGDGRRGKRRRRHRHGLPRVQGRHRHGLAYGRTGTSSACSSRRTTAGASVSESTAFLSDALIGDTDPRRRPPATSQARSSASSRPTRRCCRISATVWRNGPG